MEFNKSGANDLLTLEKATENKRKVTKGESIYTAEELANHANVLFHVSSDCVIAALKSAQIKKCTISKAKKIVKAFQKKEIK